MLSTQMKSEWSKILLAVSLVALAALIRSVFIPGLRETPYVIFYPAVIITALYGGLRPGLLAVFLSVIGSATWFGPGLNLDFYIPGKPVGLVAFLTGGAIIVFISAQLIEAKRKITAEALRLRESERSLQSEVAGRSHAEESLKKSESYLNAIIENAPACIKLVAADGTLIKMNNAGLRIIGSDSLERIEGKSIYNFVAPQDRTAFIKLTRDVFENKAGSLEFEADTLDGRHLWLNTHAVPLYDSAGTITALLGITVDITERKTIELALRESQARLEAIASTAFDAIILIDNDGNVSFWNDSATRMFGYTREEMVGKHMHSYLMPGRHNDAFQTGFAEFRKTGTGPLVGTVYEVEAKRKDGTQFPVELSVAALKLQGKWCAIGIVRDITDRKRAEKELLRISWKNKLILESAGEGIWGVDTNGNVTFINRTAAATLGYEVDELIGEPSHAKWHYKRPDGGPYPPEECPIYAAYKDGVDHTGQETFWKKDGSGFPADFTSRPIFKDSTITGAVVTFRDITRRKQAEEALRNSEERLRVAAIAAEIGMWYWTPGTSYVEVTANWRQLFGIGPDVHVTFETWSGALHPDDRERAVRELNKANEEHREFNTEYRVVRPDGTMRWLVDRGRAWYDGQGRPIGMAGVNVDITERKRTEVALQESENRLKHALQEAEQAKEFYRVMGEALPYGVWMCGPDGGAQYVSQSFLDLLEMTMDEIKQFGWTRRLPPEDVKPMLEKWLHCVSTGEPWDDVHRVYGPDKKLHYVLTRGLPVRDRNGIIVAWVGINLDIDDRMRMEDELRASEERFRMLFTNMTEGFALGEPIYHDGAAVDFRFIEMNDAFERLTGLTRDILGKPMTAVLPNLEKSWVETYCRVAQTGESVKFENYNRDTDRYYEVFGYRPSNGRFAIIFLDVTDRKRAEMERERLIAELQRSNSELEQFAYVASHDLQEPLRMVSSYVALLQRRYRERLDEKAEQYIRFAVEGADRMQNLIEGLLDYSRITRRGADFKPVDLNSVFSAALSNLAVTIRDSGAQITRDELPIVPGDKTQLVQLFQNLIGNGIKYRKPDVPAQVHVAGKKDGLNYVLSVRDNGIGIESKYFEKIFQIFQRLHTRSQYSGTGIGLALCKRIVERHHGRIWLESVPGEGSTFFFTIPIRSHPSPGSPLKAENKGALFFEERVR